MNYSKVEFGFLRLEKVLLALEYIVGRPYEEDRSGIDATTLRFKFVFDLFLKLLKAILETKGVEVQYPKDVLRESFKGHLIDHEDQWLEMLKDRNLSSHTYDEKLADEIFARVKEYVVVFRVTFDKLRKNIS